MTALLVKTIQRLSFCDIIYQKKQGLEHVLMAGDVAVDAVLAQSANGSFTCFDSFLNYGEGLKNIP